MTYKIHLIEEKTKQIIHHFDSVFVPMAGDIYLLSPAENGVCFAVKCRILPDSDSNRMVCLGTKQAVSDVSKVKIIC
jgi:hypothetical protein